MNLVYKIGIFTFVIYNVIEIFSQETSNPKFELSTIAQANQGNSYITFPTDIGNMEPLIFEANLIPNFIIRENSNSKLIGVLTPQIIIRMYNQYSYPVKTPSYRPQVTLYYNFKESSTFKKVIFGRLAHHSNGQNDSLIYYNGLLNIDSGDFSTDYIEAGYIFTNLAPKTNAVRFFKSSLEFHPKNSTHELLNNSYQRWRWHNEFSAFKVPINGQNKKARMSLDIKTTVFLGNINDIPTFSTDRFQMSVTYSYFPKFLEDIGFFVQFYQGKDFYNVYYNQDRTMLRFGLMTDKLRF